MTNNFKLFLIAFAFLITIIITMALLSTLLHGRKKDSPYPNETLVPLKNKIVDKFANKIELKNSSAKTIRVTIDLLGSKSRLGVIRNKTTKSNSFLPNLSELKNFDVYWSFKEEKRYFHFYKIEFDLTKANFPKDIYKAEVVVSEELNWTLNLYSKTIPLFSFTSKSVVLQTPYNDYLDFWDNDEYAKKEYVGETYSQEMLKNVEKKLNCKLPLSYIELLQIQNGGIPFTTKYKTNIPTSWANEHVAISGIYGADDAKADSICGISGNELWLDEWQYPKIGIYFANCAAGGYNMLCLDYRKCGPTGEPMVVNVDQGRNFKITPVADTFEDFIYGLESNDELQ